MDTVPSEIIDLFFSYLPSPSIKSFRSVCISLARIGEDHLFQNFEFCIYPQRKRLDQLRELVASPIATRLRTLTYESGVQLEWADYRYWKAQVYQAVSSNFSRGTISDGISQDTYERFHTTLDARFTSEMGERYNQYRDWLDQEASTTASPQMIAELSALVGKLPHVETFRIIMAEPEITLPALENFSSEKWLQHAGDVLKALDPRSRVQKRRQDCLEHFIGFVEAVTNLPYDVTDFSARNMPRELLNEAARRDSSVLREVFQKSRHLNLGISEFPFSDWLSRGGQEIYYRGRNVAALHLVRLLRQPHDLESLSLEFAEERQAEFSFELFDQTNLDRFPRVWLSRLEEFRLSNFRCVWDDLTALLESAPEVKRLTLKNCTLDTGHMTDLIYGLRSLKLIQICIEGTWSVSEDEGIWHSHDPTSFTDCSSSTSYEGPYATEGLRHKVEKYILHGGSCPLPMWSVDGDEEKVWELEGDTSWHYIPQLGI